MNINKVLQLYRDGKYNACIKIFDEKMKSSSDTSNELCLILDNIDDSTKDFLYLNNALLCEAIVESSRTVQKWSELMNRFIKLLSKYRSLKAVPLDLELNAVYNMLWWFCMESSHSLNYKTLHFKEMLDAVSRCLIKVLNCSKLSLDLVWTDNILGIVNLLKQASDQLLCLSVTVCMQLLDIITMIVHIFLKQQSENSSYELMYLLKKIICQIDLIRLHMQQGTVSGIEEIYFRFGLTCVNSTASLNNFDDSLSAFIVTGTTVCSANSEFEHAINCLKQMPESGAGDNLFTFLGNYLKAYCCLKTQHYNEAKLCLAYITSTLQPARYQTHFQQLLGKLWSEQSDHEAALVQYEAALSSTISIECLWLAATAAYKLHLSTAHLGYLKQLVQCLKRSSTETRAKLQGFEECCLSLLSRENSITMHEAIYMLSRHFYLAGYHTKSLDSYNELLMLLKTEFSECTRLLPYRIQILQEAALAHLKTNNFAGGEQLCHQLLREFVPKNTKVIIQSGTQREGYECWEAFLYGFEEDIVAMILLADIKVHTDKKKALEELNRCYNIISELREEAEEKEYVLEAQVELCDWFLSRILLRKAKLGNTDDAAQYFHRALLHKPGDKEVMFHYKKWSLWNPDHQSFDPGDHVKVFPEDHVNNLALRYVLGCSVSDEEWAALFEPESSHNVLETLFDDDD